VDLDRGENSANQRRSSIEAAAKPKETVFAHIAPQGHQADGSEDEVEQSALRPANVGFTALWTCNSHGQKSP
jgi:hypothetical protein